MEREVCETSDAIIYNTTCGTWANGQGRIITPLILSLYFETSSRCSVAIINKLKAARNTQPYGAKIMRVK